MQPAIHKGALLTGAIVVALASQPVAHAHPHAHTKEKAHKLAHRLAHKPHVKHATIAVTYTGEAARQASVSNNSFWLNGGSVDAVLSFYRGLGVAANFSVVHANDFNPRASIGKTTLAFGPRYTLDTTEWVRKGKWLKKEDWFKKMPPTQVFSESLFGLAHGFDGSFPEGNTLPSNANSFALQLGAGIDVTLWHHLGIRPIELDYIRTNLPNGTANSQNDLRLSFGVNYRWDAPTPALVPLKLTTPEPPTQ